MTSNANSGLRTKHQNSDTFPGGIRKYCFFPSTVSHTPGAHAVNSDEPLQGVPLGMLSSQSPEPGIHSKGINYWCLADLILPGEMLEQHRASCKTLSL